MGFRDVPFQSSRLGTCWKLFMQRSAKKEAEWELARAPRHLARAGPHRLASCHHQLLDRAGCSTEASGYCTSCGRLRRNSLSGFTEVQPNSSARAGTWGRVPRDGTGRQETRDLCSWPKAGLGGFLSSGRWRSIQKLGLALEPGEERKKADVGCGKAHLSSLMKVHWASC